MMTGHMAHEGSVRASANKSEVYDQLNRLIQSPYFKNSKRYPILLRYVVEKAVEGEIEGLKERVIGNAVFQRSGDYDTNDDNIVRVTAGEIRKRLALYYQQTEHAEELRIDLPPGSYVPTFQFGTARQVEPQQAPNTTSAKIPPAQISLQKNDMLTTRTWSPWIYVCLTILCAVPSAVLAGRWTAHPDTGSVDSFWSRVLPKGGNLLFCLPVGEAISNSKLKWPDGSLPLSVGDISSKESFELNSVPLADVAALVQIASAAHTNGKPHWVKGDHFTTIRDLRLGPVVLIGAWDNEWTMRLAGTLRYQFEADTTNKTYRIRDRQNPNQLDWESKIQSGEKITRDYAIVARFRDKLIDQPVVVAAGLTMYGTTAASEVLSNSKYLDSVLSQAPRGWKNENFEAVLAVDVVSGSNGTPQVVATTFW